MKYGVYDIMYIKRNAKFKERSIYYYRNFTLICIKYRWLKTSENIKCFRCQSGVWK